jgi:hypothetical protein
VRAASLPDQPLRWNDVPFEIRETYDDIRQRSRLDLALQRAAQDFGSAPGYRKHLLVVSDGELDVGPGNRPTGAPHQAEERAAYIRIFKETVPALRRLGVTVDTIAINAGDFPEQRVRAELLETGGRTVSEQFLAFLQKQPAAEGAHFLYALARSLSGQFRPIAGESGLANVMWQSIFPESVRRRAVAPGSTALLVFARNDEAVQLCLGDGGSERQVVIHRNAGTGAVSVEPANAGVAARYQATTHHTVWLIQAPAATCVEPGTAYHSNNVELRWASAELPWLRLNVPVELVRSGGQEPSSKWWRDHLEGLIRRGELSAVARIWPPDSEQPSDMELTPEVVAEDDSDNDAVLRLTGREWTTPGTYRAEVRLVVGRGDSAWEEILAPADLVVPGTPPWRVYLWVAFGVAAWFRRKQIWSLIHRAWLLADDLFVRVSHRGVPFSFRVYRDGAPVGITKAKHPRAVRMSAVDGGLTVDFGTRVNGQGPAAFFEAAGRKNCRLHAGSGGAWEYRMTNIPEFRPLDKSGVKFPVRRFVTGKLAVDVRHHTNKGQIVQIRHIANA